MPNQIAIFGESIKIFESKDTSALPWYNKISKDISPMHSGNGHFKAFMQKSFKIGEVRARGGERVIREGRGELAK